MLIEFSVENFASIKGRVTLNLRTGTINEFEDTHTFIENDIRLLKSAVIYGANASGKSNFIKAIGFMKHMIINYSKKSQSQDIIPVNPYKLSPETENLPGLFEVVFSWQGEVFRYGFQVDSEKVTAEWLFTIAKVKEVPLFLREGEDIDVKKRFSEGKGLESKTRHNALFLSVVDQFNGKTASKIIRWFHQCKVISGLDDSAIINYTMHLLRDTKMKQAVVQFLKVADVGIWDLEATFKKTKLDDVPEAIKIELQNLLKGLEERGTKGAKVLSELDEVTIETLHKVYNEDNEHVSDVLFNLSMESEGTKKLFALSGPVIEALNSGQILFIDEFDARLHPLQTRFLLDLFHNTSTAKHHAQLVFATHDTQLLWSKKFRRDQIWFTEKDECGATDLYSLLQFKVRKDASYGKDYIRGKYGAIPFLGDFNEVIKGME